MSSFASDFSSATPQRDYVSNVGVTARAFLKALFAINVRPQAEASTAAAAPLTSRKRAKDLMAMQRMANHYEATMPGLASELRSIAARG